VLARLRAALRPRARRASVSVCAWCGATRPARGGAGVTHGICDGCLEQELAALASRRAA
jgi:hypothetical protein